jgi:hypothetical protein
MGLNVQIFVGSVQCVCRVFRLQGMEDLVIFLQVNPVPPILINVALLALSACLGFLAQRYFAGRKETREDTQKVAEEHKTTVARIAELETKLALVNAAVVPISTAFQAILIKELTHFHTPEMDALMVRVGPPTTLTPEEEARLAVMLKERMDDMGPDISDSERGAAMILPEVMKRARAEQQVLSTVEAPQVKLVAVIDTPHE